MINIHRGYTVIVCNFFLQRKLFNAEIIDVYIYLSDFNRNFAYKNIY